MIYILDLENNTVEFLNSRVADLLYREDGEYGTVDGETIFNRALHPEDRIKRKVHLAMCAMMKDGEAAEVDLRLLLSDGSYGWFRVRDLVFSRRKGGAAHLITGIVRPTDPPRPGAASSLGSTTSSGSSSSSVHSTPAESSESSVSSASSLLPIAVGETGDRSEGPENREDMARLLLRKNKEWQLLHSELQTFTTVMTQDYLETLKQVYLSLEIIISTEAHSFSNPGKAHLRRAQSMLQRLNLLTQDIASYSAIKLPDQAPTTVLPDEIIDKVLADLEIKIRTSNALFDREALPAISGHPSLLSVLFFHLLSNALKFKQTSRPLVIRIYADLLGPGETLHPAAYIDKSYYKMVIQDNGSGFDPSDHERIFEMFYKGHNRMLYKGSGTGLAIARKIMELHGGFITAGSIPGKGAEISCYFPVGISQTSP